MATVAESAFAEIFAKLVGNHFIDPIAIDIDVDEWGGVGLSSIPDHAREGIGVAAFDEIFAKRRDPRGEVSVKDHDPKGERVESEDDTGDLSGAAGFPELGLFIPAGKEVEGTEEGGVVDAVDEVAEFEAVPETHEDKGEKEAEVIGGVFSGEPASAHGGEKETHVDMIAKPEGEADMPTGPKLANILGEKRGAKVFWGVDAEETADSDGKGGVASEVEEEIKGFGVHEADPSGDARDFGNGGDPVGVDEGGDDKFVEKSAKDSADTEVEIGEKLVLGAEFFPILDESSIAVDRA